MSGLELPFGVKLVNPKPVDYYYDNEGTPWTDIASARTGIPSGIRYIGLTCIIVNTEYWWKDGILDGNLIKKVDSSTFTYVHSQSIPTQTWIIEHNMGKKPAIHIEDMSGNELIPQIYHLNINTAHAIFGNGSYSGTAHCN